MKLPIQSRPIIRSSGFSKTSTTGVQPSWDCDSNCKWYQPDCYAWKEVNCNETLACVPWWGHPYMVQLVAVMATQKEALRNDFGITDQQTCAKQALIATGAILGRLGVQAAVVGGTMLRCACYKVY